MTDSSKTDQRSNPLDQPARRSSLSELYEAGLLTQEAYEAGQRLRKGPERWWRWTDHSLLFVGSTLVLAGVVFFFAYNWSRMHVVAKFSAIEVALWICAISAAQRGLDKTAGKVLLLSASVFVGVLLAVFGQEYQTGADDWRIYMLWALLILPWVIISRFNGLWILWLVISNTSLLLAWFQSESPKVGGYVLGIFLILGMFNGLGLAAREFALHLGANWIGGRWSRQLIWFAVLAYLTIPTIALVVAPEVGNGSMGGAIGLVIALVCGHQYFRTKQPDLACLGFNLLSICIVLLVFVGKSLFEASTDAISFFFFGLIVLLTSSAAAVCLQILAGKMGDVRR